MAKVTAVTTEQRTWNAVALVLFAALCALCFTLVARYGTADFSAFGFIDLALLGLATFRLIHLLTFDKIFELVRTAFMDGRGNRLTKAARGWRRLVCEFLECIWCTGMWSAVIAVTGYFLGTWGRFAIIILAVAGLGSLFQVMSKMMAERNA